MVWWCLLVWVNPVPLTHAEGLPSLFPAPELTGLTNWINSDRIRSIKDLRGKVVLIDFWTYSCINCVRTLPYVKTWHRRYAEKGLVVLGVHAPEFRFERKPKNVIEAVRKFGIMYPVALDNGFALWRAYRNRYWPSLYLIDKKGMVRYEHYGEGNYRETETAIRELLNAEYR